MHVPFLDLKIQYQQIKPDIDKAVHKVLDSAWFVLSEHVTSFEQKFGRYLGMKHVIGTNSGTSALEIIFKSLQFKGEWEALIPANSFFATAEAVINAGGIPRFVDINENTFNIDADKIETSLGKKTQILIPVHLYGQPADMTSVLNIARSNNLIVIEDAAQAHGAEIIRRYEDATTKRIKCGTFGTAAGFSFYPGKNLGAYGDGGAVVTNNDNIAQFAKMYRDHGSRVKYEHEFVGNTDRLDSIQAAVLEVKLKYIDQWNAARRTNAEKYKYYFRDVEEVILPYVPEWAQPIWHLFVIQADKREKLAAYLKENGIGTGYHYKTPLHLLQALMHLGYQKGDFPVTEKVMSKIISLPMYAELTEEQIKYVVEKVKEFYVR